MAVFPIEVRAKVSARLASPVLRFVLRPEFSCGRRNGRIPKHPTQKLLSSIRDDFHPNWCYCAPTRKTNYYYQLPTKCKGASGCSE